MCADYTPPIGGDTVLPEARATAQMVNRYVHSATTYTGGNNQSVAVTISGIGFTQDVRVELRDAEGNVIGVFYPSSGTSSNMTIMLDLAGLPPGDVEIFVVWPDEEEMALGRDFTITGEGSVLRTINAHVGPVRSVVFNSDGTQLLTSGDDRVSRRWNVSNGTELRRYVGHTSSVRRAVFSPDGLEVATGSLDNSVRLWDSTLGEQLSYMVQTTGAGINTVAFSPDGDQVFAGYNNGEGVAWDLNTGLQAVYFGGHEAAVISSEYFLDGSRLVTGNGDGRARVWDGKTGDLLATFNTGVSGVTVAAFSPDARRVVTGSTNGAI